MKTLLLFLLVAAVLHARQWTDIKGQTTLATLSEVGATSVKLRLRGGKMISVDRFRLSAEDRSYVDRCEAGRETALRLRVRVIQALPDGVLCATYVRRSVPGTMREKKWYSKLEGRWTYQDVPHTEIHEEAVDGTAYIHGLDTAASGESFEVIVWRSFRPYHYETVLGASETVPAYEMEPPQANDAGDNFGR